MKAIFQIVAALAALVAFVMSVDLVVSEHRRRRSLRRIGRR
ncbi:hypothetical protein [Microbacterium sp.]|nr:hypothetical protein [Microbacterium sp.]HEX5730961.1 hypothetical protein [Microbacterium sp.]